MELKLTSGQHFTSVAQPYLESVETYQFQRDRNDMMVRLIHYLKQNIEGPPQWVTISMPRRYFYIMEVDTCEITNARVQITGFCKIYYIQYRMPDEQAPWDNEIGTWVLGETDDIEEAGRMVIIALERAATNLPITGAELQS